MGKKKAKVEESGPARPFCYFCDKDFENENVLIQHQISKHFRCRECIGEMGNRGKCETIAGLAMHTLKIHAKRLKQVPNAIPGRDDPNAGVNIYGSEGVPAEMLTARGLEVGHHLPQVAGSNVPLTRQGVQQPLPPDMPPAPMPINMLQTQAMQAMPSPVQQEVQPRHQPSMEEKPNFQHDVAAWMAKKQLEEEQEAAREEARIKAEEEQRKKLEEQMAQMPSMPAMGLGGNGMAPPNHLLLVPPMPQTIQPRPGMGGFGLPQQQGFPQPLGIPGAQPLGFPGTQPQVEAQPDDIATTIAECAEMARQAAARPFSMPSKPKDVAALQHVFGTEEDDNIASMVPQKKSSIPLPEKDGDKKSRSRSRRRDRDRSRSRGKRDRDSGGGGGGSAGKGGGGFGGGFGGGGGGASNDPMEARTIQITEGVTVTTARLWLKKEMEKYGRVEVCHMGNRQQPGVDIPWVRFEKAIHAEAALQAISQGLVFMDGRKLVAEFRKGGRPPPRRDTGPPPRTARNERDLEITSRDLLNDVRRNRGGRGDTVSSRDLLKDDRRRDRSGSRSRSRGRRRRFD